MTFEKALTEELEAISGLYDKTSPIIAPKKDPPFIVYRKANIKIKKTLGGPTRKAEALYELAVVAKTYNQLQDVSDAVEAKIWSFLHRQIGTGGPLIENVTLEYTGDEYVEDVLGKDLYQCNMKLTVNY